MCPGTRVFSPAVTIMGMARLRPTLCVLPDGKVQVIGGDTESTMEMLQQAFRILNDEGLLMIEKEANRERKRRMAANVGADPQPGQHVLINLKPTIDEIREKTRYEMSISSDAVLASLLDQIGEPRDIDEETIVTALQIVLSDVFVDEAQKEMQRRLASVR